MGGNLVIRNDGYVRQRKRPVIKVTGQLRSDEFIEPAQRERIGAHQTVVEENRDHQRQAIVAGIEMALHGGDGVAHQTKGHMPVGRALVFDKRINITVARRGFQGIQNVGVKGTQIVFDKMPGLEMQRTQIAHFKQRLGQIQLQEITGGIGMGEVGLKHGVMGRGGRLFHVHPSSGLSDG